MSWRRFQNAWRWLEVDGDHRVVDDAVLHALGEDLLQRVAQRRRAASDSSISTYQGCLL